MSTPSMLLFSWVKLLFDSVPWHWEQAVMRPNYLLEYSKIMISEDYIENLSWENFINRGWSIPF